MKIRRLQQRFDDGEEWEDHGYAYAHEDGRAVFVFNPLIWERHWVRVVGFYSKVKKV